MGDQPASSESHLFTLRFWIEELGPNEAEWRGKLHHVNSGDVHYLRDSRTLITLLHKIITNSGRDGHLAPDVLLDSNA